MDESPQIPDQMLAGPAAAAGSRRRADRQVREARERLTSSGGTTPAFEYDLLHLYAQNRTGAWLMHLLLIGVAAVISSIWVGFTSAMGWAAGALAVHAYVGAQCRSFLAQTTPSANLGFWRRRFIACDLLNGLVWVVFMGQHIALAESGSGELVLFTMLLVVAVHCVLAASVPIAAAAATVPITLSITVNQILEASTTSLMFGGLAIGTQVFFLLLADRLYSSSLATLEARAETDALIGELEQAKANSDEARRVAETANVAKSRFLAQMSHELRTPLNAILGFSEVMKSEILGPHANPTYKEYAADIHGSGQHLLDLINEILDLSRIEAGRYELVEEAVSVADVVNDCSHLLKLRAQNRGLTVRQMIESDMPRLWADERALRQICLNLLSNAIKFTPQGGEIHIKAGWTASGGQYIAVKDNGPGIPEEEIPIVLSSFGQGSSSIKSAEQGAGLGLPIVQGLIALHGGTFSLRSKLRQGTEVIVTFPPSRVMAALAPMVQPLTPPPPAAPILDQNERDRVARRILMKSA